MMWLGRAEDAFGVGAGVADPCAVDGGVALRDGSVELPRSVIESLDVIFDFVACEEVGEVGVRVGVPGEKGEHELGGFAEALGELIEAEFFETCFGLFD